MPLQLKNILGEINARKVFPVHTEHAGLFAKFVGDLKCETLVAEKSKEYKI